MLRLKVTEGNEDQSVLISCSEEDEAEERTRGGQKKWRDGAAVQQIATVYAQAMQSETTSADVLQGATREWPLSASNMLNNYLLEQWEKEEEVCFKKQNEISDVSEATIPWLFICGKLCNWRYRKHWGSVYWSRMSNFLLLKTVYLIFW